MAEESSNHAIYVISVAAELAGMHPQTLRVYERKGLLRPQRTAGNTRRYSPHDIERLRRIQKLTQDGVNLAGVTAIMDLERRLEEAHSQLQAALREVDRLEQRLAECLEAHDHTSLVPVRDVRRLRRAMRSDAIDSAGRRRVFAVPPASEREPETAEVNNTTKARGS